MYFIVWLVVSVLFVWFRCLGGIVWNYFCDVDFFVFLYILFVCILFLVKCWGWDWFLFRWLGWFSCFWGWWCKLWLVFCCFCNCLREFVGIFVIVWICSCCVFLLLRLGIWLVVVVLLFFDVGMCIVVNWFIYGFCCWWVWMGLNYVCFVFLMLVFWLILCWWDRRLFFCRFWVVLLVGWICWLL